jgi:hypothetical protein
MFGIRRIAAAVCVLAIAGSVWGQPGAVETTARTKAVPAKAAPILEVVPAGSLGFAVVPNVGKTFASVEQYLKDIGVRDMLPISGDLLDALKSAVQLGDGFNSSGGFAAAMLDPVAYGIDLPKMISDGPPAGEKPKVPFVLFVPATSVKGVFGQYEMKDEDGLTHIKFRSGEGYAAMSPAGYVILSPNAQAVKDVLAAKSHAAGELSKENAAAFASADISVHMNIKAAAPLLQSLMKTGFEQADRGNRRGPMPFDTKQILAMYAKIFEMMQDMSLTLSVDKAGVTINEYVSIDPNSTMGKAMAAVKPGPAAALDRLPNLPYILAIGGSGDKAAAAKMGAEQKEMLDMVLKMLPGMSEGTIAKIMKLNEACAEQVTATQLAIGGAPEGSGLFGVAVVISCKDSGKMRAILADAADTLTDAIQSVIPGRDSADLKIAYTKEIEKVGDVFADAIEVQHPQMAKMSDREKQEMKKVLGEDRVRALVAAADDKTVVITFGGSTAMLAETLKVAKGGGTIPKDAGVMAAMKVLPKNPQSVIMIDAANALAVIKKGADTLGAPMPPIEMTGKTPLAAGSGMAGSRAQVTFFVPTDLVKDIVNMVNVMTSRSNRSGERARPVPGGQSF